MGNDNKISKLKNIYSNGNLIPFLGAGMSVPFGLPSWKQLIYNLGSKVNCNKEVLNTIEKALNNGEYLITIEFLKAAYGLSEDDIKENVRNIISQSIPLKKEMSKIDNNYKDINKYDNFNLIFTTNYDEVASQFIDTSLSPINLIIQRNNIQNAFNNSIGEKQIVHLHGSISAEETIVFTQKSYNDIYNDDMYVDTLKTYLNTKTFLFIGFSFDDMYMQHIWFENLKKFRSKHFILLDKPDNKTKKEWCFYQKECFCFILT